MSTVLAAKPWLSEPALIPLPWNSNLHISPSPSHPLKIGILLHDNVVRPHPPITRALLSIASKLSVIPNVTVVDWNPHLHDEAWAIISSLYFPDGGEEEHGVLAASGEPALPLTNWILKHTPGVEKLNMAKYAYWLEEREAYRAEYAKIWNDTATSVDEENGEREGMVDVILCPVGPGVAPKHNTARYWGYTSQWNLLDYPAVVFPVDKVDKKVDVVVERVSKPKTRTDAWHWGLCECFVVVTRGR
jgi:amidase